MDTVEVIVYMAIAVVVGALMLAFIGRWDATETFQGLKGLFSREQQEYEQISSDAFARFVLTAWESCGLGTADMNRTVYVSDDAELNKTMIFDRIRQANLCRTLQWNESGCGTRDDIVFAGAQGPAVLRLRCDAATRQLIITS